MKTTLAVVIKEKDEGIMKMLLEKPNDLKNYEENIEKVNTLLKAAIEKDWNISQDVKFITNGEAMELEKNNSPWYLLKITEVNNHTLGDYFNAFPGNLNQRLTGSAGVVGSLGSIAAYHLSSPGSTVALVIAPAARPNHGVVISYLPSLGISAGAFTYMIGHLKNQVLDGAKGVASWGGLKAEIRKRRDGLKSKTLLIYAPFVSKELQKAMVDNAIQKYYPYAIEYVSLNKLEEVIVNKDKKCAYIWVVPAAMVDQGKMEFYYYIIDAADSRPLFVTGLTGVEGDGVFYQAHLVLASRKLKK